MLNQKEQEVDQEKLKLLMMIQFLILIKILKNNLQKVYNLLLIVLHLDKCAKYLINTIFHYPNKHWNRYNNYIKTINYDRYQKKIFPQFTIKS